MSDAEIANQLDAIEQSGARWVRLEFPWDELQGAPGAPLTDGPDSRTNLRAAVQALRSRGLSIMGTVTRIPEWANQSASRTVPVTNLEVWAQFLQQLHAAYGADVSYWSVLNEVNCHGDGGGVGFQGTPAEYDAMWVRALQVLPEGSVTMGEPTITFGNPALQCTPESGWISGRLAAAAAAGKPVSVIAVHAYNDWAEPIVTAVRSLAWTFGQPGARSVWLTEFAMPEPLAWPSSRASDSVAVGVVSGVLRGMRDTDPTWGKSFYWRLWADALERPDWNMLAIFPGGDGTFARRDTWHMYRHVALNGPDWQPVDRWWRWADGLWSTTPGEGHPGGYYLRTENHWSTSKYGYAGWHPLFRCRVHDPETNDGHYIGSRHTCDEHFHYRAGTLEQSIGFAADHPHPELGLVPLYRFKHEPASDYVHTTDEDEASRLRSGEYGHDWVELPILGWVWPSGYRP